MCPAPLQGNITTGNNIMENTSNSMNLDSELELQPLKINSYKNLFINMINNSHGVLISISKNQLDIKIGDRYEIYYAPVLSNDCIGEPVLITRNVVSEVNAAPYIPAFLTPSKFFPIKKKSSIKLWYVIIKENGESLKSEPILQFLETA